MADLQVDYQLLESTEVLLRRLGGEFENIEAVQADFEGAMGSDAVAAAMADFAGNWTYHRERLIASMQNLAAMARETVQEFRRADGQLTKDLHPQ